MNPILDELSRTPIMELNYAIHPPDGLVSINALYSEYRGRRVLTAQGKKLKTAIKDATASATLALAHLDPSWSFALQTIYNEGFHACLLINFYMKSFWNGQFKIGGSKTEGGNLRTAYQKRDVTNYIKLVEDGIVAGAAIDDAAHVLVAAMKHPAKSDRIDICYRIHE